MLNEYESRAFYIIYHVTKDGEHISFLRNVAISPSNSEVKMRKFPDLQTRAAAMRTTRRDVKGGLTKKKARYATTRSIKGIFFFKSCRFNINIHMPKTWYHRQNFYSIRSFSGDIHPNPARHPFVSQRRRLGRW